MFHGLDTLTPEQANDILIGHQKSLDKGLGEVIICYKIISTLSSLCEHWVETTTERGGQEGAELSGANYSWSPHKTSETKIQSKI